MDKYEWMGLAALVVVVTALLAIALGFSAWTCGNRWEDSGMASRWKFGSGCQVQHQGNWIPEERYRVVEE